LELGWPPVTTFIQTGSITPRKSACHNSMQTGGYMPLPKLPQYPVHTRRGELQISLDALENFDSALYVATIPQISCPQPSHDGPTQAQENYLMARVLKTCFVTSRVRGLNVSYCPGPRCFIFCVPLNPLVSTVCFELCLLSQYPTDTMCPTDTQIVICATDNCNPTDDRTCNPCWLPPCIYALCRRGSVVLKMAAGPIAERNQGNNNDGDNRSLVRLMGCLKKLCIFLKFLNCSVESGTLLLI
jgi:hypothetical protein